MLPNLSDSVRQIRGIFKTDNYVSWAITLSYRYLIITLNKVSLSCLVNEAGIKRFQDQYPISIKKILNINYKEN